MLRLLMAKTRGRKMEIEFFFFFFFFAIAIVIDCHHRHPKLGIRFIDFVWD